MTAETDDGFEYLVDDRDIAYQSGGNMPMILVVTRAQHNEAYCADLERDFALPAAQKAREVRFQKRAMAFALKFLSV